MRMIITSLIKLSSIQSKTPPLLTPGVSSDMDGVVEVVPKFKSFVIVDKSTSCWVNILLLIYKKAYIIFYVNK